MSSTFGPTCLPLLLPRELSVSMPVYELQVDPQATVDVWISPAAFPPGTARDDVLAIRPAEVGKGKAKDRPLLYKVDKLQADDDGEQNSQNARRRGKAQVVVASNIASSFPWIKNRQDVFVTLVSAFFHRRPPGVCLQTCC